MTDRPPRKWEQRHPFLYALVVAPAILVLVAALQVRGLEEIVFFGVLGAVLALGGLGLSGMWQTRVARHRSEYEEEERALEEGR